MTPPCDDSAAATHKPATVGTNACTTAGGDSATHQNVRIATKVRIGDFAGGKAPRSAGQLFHQLVGVGDGDLGLLHNGNAAVRLQSSRRVRSKQSCRSHLEHVLALCCDAHARIPAQRAHEVAVFRDALHTSARQRLGCCCRRANGQRPMQQAAHIHTKCNAADRSSTL
jgi:hypothetical protein